jgi:predicted ATPase/DNA-binding SARP family transcriptional activator
VHHVPVILLAVLGPLELCGPDGAPVPVTSLRQRRLLAALCLQRGTPVAVDVLAEHVWGDEQPADPAAALQTNVARLRRILPPGVELVTGPGSYRLVVDRGALDVTAFEDALAERRPEDALAVWRGRPYVELDGDTVAAEASRLGELRSAAVEARAEALLGAGRAAEAAAALEALVGDEPLREAAVALLMRALVAAGRQSDALRAFTRLRTALAEQLGIEPSAALRALEEQILRQELTTLPVPPPARMPVPVSSFVGRGEEVRQVTALLSSSRVVTVCGPGGVGKTRLARHVAHGVADRYADGVVVVDLATSTTLDEVTTTVAAALRVTASPDAPLTDRIVEVLGVRRRLLLLLDDCEHVAEPVAHLVEAVITQTHGVDVLATSREPLRVDGEHVVPLAPLPPRDAASLLRDRIRAAAPDALVDGVDDAVLVELAASLDGLPLALELAAARVPALGLAGLADALDEPLDILRQGRRTAEPRHRSLRDTVEWSYELLTEPERELFLAMSVFAGMVDAEAVADVCLDECSPSRAGGALADLVDRSLVVVAPGPPSRYGMLTTIRSYGRGLLAASRRGVELRARHAAWAVGLVGWLRDAQVGPDEPAAARRLDENVAELARALAWLSEHGRIDDVLAMGMVLAPAAYERMRADLARMVDDVLAVVGEVRHPLTPRVLGTAAALRWQRGDLAGAEAQSLQALRIAEDVGAESGRDAEQVLSNVAMFRVDLDAARAHGARALELALRAGDRAVAASVHIDMAMIEAYLGDPDAGAAHLAAGSAIAEELGSPRLRGWSAYVAGETVVESDPAAAAPHLERAVGIASSIDATFLATVGRHTLLTSAGRSGDVGLDALAGLVDDWHRAGTWTQLWVAVRALIDSASRQGRHEDVARLLGAHGASTRAAPPFGPDQERLTAAEAAARAVLGDAFDERYGEGAALGDDGAVALAHRLGEPWG